MHGMVMLAKLQLQCLGCSMHACLHMLCNCNSSSCTYHMVCRFVLCLPGCMQTQTSRCTAVFEVLSHAGASWSCRCWPCCCLSCTTCCCCAGTCCCCGLLQCAIPFCQQVAPYAPVKATKIIFYTGWLFSVDGTWTSTGGVLSCARFEALLLLSLIRNYDTVTQAYAVLFTLQY